MSFEITSEEALDALLGVRRPEPGQPSKQLDRIDEHGAAFIATSPLMMLGTADAEGRLDVSPRGDEAGFVKVLSSKRLIIPDRKGNHRFDSLRNIVARPDIGALFLIPGREDTLRINGRARITSDPALTEQCEVNGSTPKVVIDVEVDELFFHCARSLLRGSAWKPAKWPASDHLATLGKALKDQMNLDFSVELIDADLDRANNDLY